MALVKCRECATEVSSSAAVCPKCGLKKPQPKGLFGRVASGIGMVLIAVIVFRCSFGTGEAINKVTAEPSTPAVASAPAYVPPPPLIRKWQYTDEVDSMRKRSTRSASTKSLEQLVFPFPYNRGENFAELGLVSNSSGSKLAYLSVDHGQFLCHTYSCAVTVQIDDQPPKRMTGSQEGSGKSDVILLPYSTMLPLLRKGQVMTIEAPFFQQGVRQMVFKVEGLQWQ